MNMKNAMIFLLFFLCILGLVVGVYYSEDASHEKPSKTGWKRVYGDDDGVLTITLEKIEIMNIDELLT